MDAAAPHRIETLGTLALLGPTQRIEASDQRQQRRRLALLAALAAAGERGRTRDQLLVLFWPDATERKARHSLDQLLYAIRRSTSDSIFLGVNPIRLNSAEISSDVGDFEQLLGDGRPDLAIRCYRGPFLDGFYLTESREFEEWLDGERRRLAARYEEALDALASQAERALEFDAAIRFRRQIADADPLSGRKALALLRTLVSSGDSSAALRYAETHEQMVSRELGTSASPEVAAFVASVASAPVLVRSAISNPPAIVVERHAESREAAASSPERRSTAEKRRLGMAIGTLAAIGLAATVMSLALARSPQPIPAPSPTAATPTVSRPKSIAAYEAYQHGNDPALMRSDSAANAGVEYFKEAIAADPTWAPAYGGLARMYTRLALGHSDMPHAERLARAHAAALKAVELDSSLAEAHLELGFVDAISLDLVDAERELRHTLAIDPRYPSAHEYLAAAYSLAGRFDDALDEARREVAIAPLVASSRAELARHLYFNKRCDEALQVLDSLEGVRPPVLRAIEVRALCLIEKGQVTDAIAVLRPRAATTNANFSGVLGYALAITGSPDQARAIRGQLLERWNRSQESASEIAMISLGLGDTTEAASWYVKAIGTRQIAPGLLGPTFDALRRDQSVQRAMRVALKAPLQ